MPTRSYISGFLFLQRNKVSAISVDYSNKDRDLAIAFWKLLLPDYVFINEWTKFVETQKSISKDVWNAVSVVDIVLGLYHHVSPTT